MVIDGHEVFGETQNAGDQRMTIEVVTNVWRDVESDGAPLTLLCAAVSNMVGNMADGVGRIVAAPLR